VFNFWVMGRVNSRVVALTIALVAIGVTATASQVLILRELFVGFHGNELFIGIILGTWLFLEAVGSYVSRGRADQIRSPAGAFVALQCLIGLSPLVSILAIRAFKYALGIPVGEALGVQHVVLVSLVALAPICVADGAVFPFACRALGDLQGREEAPARTYLFQSLGSFAAGVMCVVYFLLYLTPVEVSVLLLLVNLCSALVLLQSVGASSLIRCAASGLLILTGVTLVSPGPRWLERESAKLQWYEYSLVDTRHSLYSHLAVIADRDQYTFFANGIPYATAPNPGVQIEEFVHFPLLFHPQPERLLVIGGGAGGLLREVLKHPVDTVDYAEQDPLIVEQFRRFPTPLTEYELAHPKVRVHPVEGRRFLRTTPGQYDLILVNLPVASTLSLNRFYTVEFYQLARRRLKARGLLALRLPGSETLLSRELGVLNGRAYASLKGAFGHVAVIAGEQNIFIASGDPAAIAVGRDVLIERLKSRGIELGLVNEGYIRYKTDERRFLGLKEKIVAFEEADLNRDGDPRGVIDGLAYLSSIVSPFMAGMLGLIGRLPALAYLAAVAVPICVCVLIQARRNSRVFLPYAVASTGMAGMILTVLLILAFQIYYGYVYHHIAILTSLFMLGAGAGAWWSLKRKDTPLLYIEVGMVVLAMAAYVTIAVEPVALRGQVAIFTLMFLSGLFTGLEFPVAVAVADRSCLRVGTTAGGLYAVDLLGAVVGALLAAIALIPGIGLKQTIVLAGLMKIGSVILVVQARSWGQGGKAA